MKSTKLLLILTALLLLSLACSLGGAQEPVSSSEIEEAEQPEEVPPTETAVPTAEPTPTDIPTSTPAPPTPTPEPTEDLLVSRPMNTDPCTNVLYPLIEGYQYIYEIIYQDELGAEQSDQLGITISKVENSEAVVDMLNISTGITTQSTVSCENGSLVNFPVILLNFLVSEVDGDLDLEHTDGLFAPSFETLMVENWVYEWTSQYIANGMINIDVEGETTSATLTDTVIDMNWEVRGEDEMFETVEVPAGVYENAVKVYRETSFDIKLSLSESGFSSMEIDAILDLKMLLYYEPNLGMIKQVVESANISLMGITSPIAIDGTMQLKEFRNGE